MNIYFINIQKEGYKRGEDRMKKQRKRIGNPAITGTHDVQSIGFINGGDVQELVGIYIVAVLLFVAFSIWFSFEMFQ